jgi:cell division protein ZapA
MASRVVTVEIAGQQYPIRSALDERYVAMLASYVEEKMAAASSSAPASDTVGLAILVALNLADEVFRAREESTALGELNDRAMRLERIVDDVLAEVTPPKPLTLLDHPRSAG